MYDRVNHEKLILMKIDDKIGKNPTKTIAFIVNIGINYDENSFMRK
jgi:hypothetical protein